MQTKKNQHYFSDPNFKLLTILIDNLTPIDTYKVESIDSISFETSSVPTLRDLDQNQNVTITAMIGSEPNTPGKFTKKN